MNNTNCLEGMKCPACQQHGAFNIEARVMLRVENTGAQDCLDTLQWNGNSYCQCAITSCAFHGKVRDFMNHLTRLQYDEYGWYVLPPAEEPAVMGSLRPHYATLQQAHNASMVIPLTKGAKG